MPRKTYRVNADLWTVLQDILVGIPEDFNPDSATLRGRNVSSTNGFVNTGMLPRTYADDMADGVVKYVIYSYQTPIAYRRIADWPADGIPCYEWVIPDVRYSVTTSKHQGKVRTAISQINT